MDYFYEAKTIFNKVKHAVLNLTEMESKVMEATNDEKWGASSTLMQEIARGTFNFQQFNEIMNIITKRLTEREPMKWRNVYKALTLLEYLIKNGSEKVVDYSRAHISVIKSLRSFQYIDEKSKDQGINVKQRSKEIVELLSSTERIKEERKKAKANKSKYVGIGSEPAGFGSTSASNGFGGFSSGPSYSSSGFGSTFAGSGFDGPSSRSRFEDEYDDSSFKKEHSPPSRLKSESPLPPTPKVEDLFNFDEPAPAPAPISSSKNKSTFNDNGWSDFKGSNNDNDDFGDFQSTSNVKMNPTTTVNNDLFSLDFKAPITNTTTGNNQKDTLSDLLGELDSFNSSNNITTAQSLYNNILQPISNAKVEINKTINNDNGKTTNDLMSKHEDLFSLDSLSFNSQNNNKHHKQPSMNQMMQNNTSSFNPNSNLNTNFNLNSNNLNSLNNSFNNLNIRTQSKVNSNQGLSANDLKEFDSFI